MVLYVAQFGMVWRVTEDALRRLLDEGARTGGHTVVGDGVTALQTPLCTLRNGRALPARWRGPNKLLLRLLDWDREQYRRALFALDRKDWDALRYGP